MHFISETTVDGVSTQQFVLGDIPGVLWTSAAAAPGPRPLILLGHGGGQHKQAPGVLARAHRYVSACGFTAAAIDLPGHGDRPKVEADEEHVASIRQRATAGEPIGPLLARYNADVAIRAVPEWRATLDALHDLGHAAGPVGFWGVSMGGAIGIPLVSVETRISAAVLGLTGHPSLIEAASLITVPVEFILQWDDDLVPLAEGLALFNALGSTQKSLHANLGGHLGVPAFEAESAERFFGRHLVTQ